MRRKKKMAGLLQKDKFDRRLRLTYHHSTKSYRQAMAAAF
jgi:hypothetical protein